MEKKKRFSILKLLIVIVCLSLLIVSLAANILFSRNNVPALFGRHIYVVNGANPMEGDITTGAALMAKDAEGITVLTGDIILCYPADAPDKIALRSINSITENDDGSQNYYTRDNLHEDTAGAIPKDKIVAVCTGNPESFALGQFISFALSVKGILALLVLPSVILVIFIIATIVRSRSEADFDEDFGFYEYEEEPAAEPASQPHPTNSDKPLFKPNPDVLPNPELERKKMSIAENFSHKEVNPDSPYQKEKERTMQFKAQRASSLSNTMSFTATSTAESSFAARNQNAQSGAAPTADALREEMLRKKINPERTASFSAPRKVQPESSIPDNTGILSKIQVEELSKTEASPAEISKPTSRPVNVQPKKSSSPDISDILGSTAGVRRKKDPSEMSVDDLLKMIEDEKKKL